MASTSVVMCQTIWLPHQKEYQNPHKPEPTYLAALFEFIMGEFGGPMELTLSNVNFQDKGAIDRNIS